MHTFRTAALLLIGFALMGCGQAGETTAPPASWLLTEAPAGAQGVAAVKAKAKEGDRVTVRGKIGGRLEPLSPDSGLFVMMDPAVPSCTDNSNDACPTPWDYCCEPPETIAATAATVQVRDANGDSVTFSEGQLKNLDEVIVVGTVAPRPNADTLVVLAEGVYGTPSPIP